MPRRVRLRPMRPGASCRCSAGSSQCRACGEQGLVATGRAGPVPAASRAGSARARATAASPRARAARPGRARRRVAQCLRRLRRIDAPRRPRVEHDAVEAALAPRYQRARRSVPAHDVAFDEALREVGAQARLVHRRGAQQQRVARLEAQFAGHQPGLAVQRAVVGQARHAAVGELVAARVAGMLARDAVGKGVREQVAERMRGCFDRRLGGAAQAPPPLRAGLVDRRQRAAVGIGRRAPAAEGRQRLPARRPVVATRAQQRIARLHQRRQVAGQRAARHPRGPPAASPPAAGACPAPASRVRAR